jgi:5'-nucleotidase
MSTEHELLILVDMDGVLADFSGGWMRDWNLKYPDRKVDPTTELTNFYIEESFKGLGTEEELVEIFTRDGFYYDLEPMPGAIEGFRNMAAQPGIELFICTAPMDNSSYTEKANWVEHYLGKEWLKKLVVTKDKTLIVGDYLIDDKPEIKGIYSDPAWEHILFEQPYNENDPKKRLRINWKTWPSLFLHHAKK